MRELLVGFAWGTMLAVPFALWALWGAITTPLPYRDVHILRAEVVGRSLHLTANFIKNDACAFELLEPRGLALNQWAVLPWADATGGPSDVDRLEGHQTLRIVIQWPGIDPSLIEVWTRHNCGGAKVDKMFARIDPASPVIPPATQSGNGGHLGPAR